DAIRTREGAEVVVEGAVLLHDDHHVLDLVDASSRRLRKRRCRCPSGYLDGRWRAGCCCEGRNPSKKKEICAHLPIGYLETEKLNNFLTESTSPLPGPDPPRS